MKRAIFAIAVMAAAQTPTDKYQWLEDVNSPRSMAWVKTENERSAKILESDPHFATLQADALKVLESPDRLAIPALNGVDIYNTWQDATHVRGILRRTTLTSYLTLQPDWQTLIDYDALGKQDNEKWVQKGRTCLYPGNELCLISLSAGGEDANTLREVNLKTGKFVEGGLTLPKSKGPVSWVDKDTLLIARDFGPGTLTTSGYPFIVKRWKRGQPIALAKEIFRGIPSDEEVVSDELNDSDGHHASLILRFTKNDPNSLPNELIATGAERVAARSFLAVALGGDEHSLVRRPRLFP